MRLDLLLVRLRLARSRSLAQQQIGEARIRLNSQRVVRRDQQVKPGDVLTLPTGNGVTVLRLLALPVRRGPPAEARACYEVLDAGAPIALAGGE
ncbi:MAG: S4 domain-containing protein [Alteraurantiacibacter sp.]|nr:S4 domain-containing protein [Alteraurantiacibacter sp.]